VALIALAASGCGGPAHQFGTVEGTVRLKGKPVEGIYLEFTPDPDKGGRGPSSQGTSGPDGRYTLKYADPKTSAAGAVVGWHRVLAYDLKRPTAAQGEAPKPSRVADTYSQLGTTPLKFEVKPGSQTIDIDLP
jgi:hypothetical protein